MERIVRYGPPGVWDRLRGGTKRLFQDRVVHLSKRKLEGGGLGKEVLLILRGPPQRVERDQGGAVKNGERSELRAFLAPAEGLL